MLESMFGESSFKTTVPGEGHLDEDEILLEIDGVEVKINSKTRVCFVSLTLVGK